MKHHRFALDVSLLSDEEPQALRQHVQKRGGKRMDEEKLLIFAWNHAKSLRKTITEPTEEDEMVWGIEDKRYERRLWEAQKEKM